VIYDAGEFYTPGSEGGLLYNDPRLGLKWPLPIAFMSPKDREWSPLDEVEEKLRCRMRIAGRPTSDDHSLRPRRGGSPSSR
jgi:dTDP-4-dehydrorhamnose 3,5-epimerase